MDILDTYLMINSKFRKYRTPHKIPLLSSRQRLWKDASPVPRMGRTRRVCSRCFLQSTLTVLLQSCHPCCVHDSRLTLLPMSSPPLFPPVGPESGPILRVLLCCLSIPGGGRAEAGLHQRHAPGPGRLPACHAASAEHP